MWIVACDLGDIVEVLQMLKSIFKSKELFCVPPPMSIDTNEDHVSQDNLDGGWDCFLDNAPDNYKPDVTVF